MSSVQDTPGLGFVRGERPAPPRQLLVFGATGQLGGPLVERVLSRPNPPAVRLVATSAGRVSLLQERFPQAEVVVGSYYDLPSLMRAFAGVEAAFVVTPDFATRERLAMTNVAAAALHAGTLTHLVRLTASATGRYRVSDLLPLVRDVNGPSRQYQEAREVLTATGIPVSYLNVYAYLMSDMLTLWIGALITQHVFLNPYDRTTTFLDSRDVGEAAAELMLAGHDRHHDGTWYTVTGSERLRFSEVADILSEELDLPIVYEDDPQRFYEETAPWSAKMGSDDPEWGLRFQQAEYREEPTFVVTDTLPSLIGRSPKTLRAWIAEHRADLRGETEIGQRIRAAAATAE